MCDGSGRRLRLLYLIVRLAPLREVQRVDVPGEQRLEEQRLLAHPQNAQRLRRLHVKATGAEWVRRSEPSDSAIPLTSWCERGREGRGEEGTCPAASPTTKRQSSAAPKRRSSGAWRSLCASSESRTICATCKQVASGC